MLLSELLNLLKVECPNFSDVIVDLPMTNGHSDRLGSLGQRITDADADADEADPVDDDLMTGCLSDPTLQVNKLLL